MSRCVLAIDLGSSGVKVAVVDPEGAVRGGAGEGLPTVLVAGDGAEQDPAVWWDVIGRCSRRALQTTGTAAAQIGMVAVTSQYTSTVAVDAGGLPVANAIMWMDGRTGAHHPFGSRQATEQRELLAYLKYTQARVHESLAAETTRSLAAPAGFSWLKMTRAEVPMYSMRHVQHHIGQLSAYLRRASVKPKWTKGGVAK